MRLYQHRSNSLSQLNLPEHLGVEFDVRTVDGELRVCHDYLKDSPRLEEYLGALGNRSAILNIKEAGISDEVNSILNTMGKANCLMLDVPMPEFVGLVEANQGSRLVVRVSQFEIPPSEFLKVSGAEWIWLDLFNLSDLPTSLLREARDTLGMRICLASPELYGMKQRFTLKDTMDFIRRQRIELDGVCTKSPDSWRAWFRA